MNLLSTFQLYCGGSGSGCKGPNCGRKKSKTVTNMRYMYKNMNPNYHEYGTLVGAKFFVRADGKIKLASDNEHQYEAESMGYHPDNDNDDWRKDVVKDGHIMGTVAGNELSLESSTDPTAISKIKQIVSDYPAERVALSITRFSGNKGKSALEFVGSPKDALRKIATIKAQSTIRSIQ